ncbi:hypothetical protein RDI58_017431 [Solanum bulbocastanum]|uniref:Uncharacterized protein n=1 Tax=Solanum bulbocastanum TaxID=147425 RepID=A0AAN8TF01_SOLBU
MHNNVVSKTTRVSVPTRHVAVSLGGVEIVVTTADLAAKVTVMLEVVSPPCSPMKPSTIVANTWMKVGTTGDDFGEIPMTKVAQNLTFCIKTPKCHLQLWVEHFSYNESPISEDTFVNRAETPRTN